MNETCTAPYSAGEPAHETEASPLPSDRLYQFAAMTAVLVLLATLF